MATHSSPDHGPGVGPGIHEEGSAYPTSPGGAPPLPDDATFEERESHWRRHVYQGDSVPQLTLRAIGMGVVIGMLMSVSNLYTTLKIGWAFGVVVTACVLSYVAWNFMRLLSGKRLSQMSMLENACMASTASAAGYSTGSTIATMFGALLILKTDKVEGNVRTLDTLDWRVVALFTLFTGLLGVFLAIPMKRQMINRERLAFPTGTAAATTLKSLYAHGKEAVQQAYSLIVAMFVGLGIGVINSPRGIFSDAMPVRTLADGTTGNATAPGWARWIETKLFGHLPELVPHHGFRQITQQGKWVNAVTDQGFDKAVGKQLPAFGFEPSGLLIAAGMLVGMRVCLSMLFGAVLLYVVVGPWMISMDDAALAWNSPLRNVKLNSASQTAFQLVHWGLWGGTATMVMSSLAAVALQWRVIARSFTGFRKGASASGGVNTDLEVPTKWFFVGLVPITIAMVAVQAVAFSIHWWLGLAAVAMSFVLSLVASRATGETDTTPVGAMGKVMQLIFAITMPQQVIPNLAAAGVAANSASSSADLLTDLKTGYLVGANPRRQFWAQFIGVFFGTLAIVPAWYLMVPDKRTLETYPLPATQQWVAVARLLTEGVQNLPITARWAIAIGAIVGVALPIIDRLAPKKVKPYLPSAMGLGLSWVMPFTNCLSFAVGAVITWIWSLFARKNADRYNVPIASGLIAGEGLIKAIIAMTATGLGLTAAAGAP